MATLAELETRREALKAAIDSGVLTLREGDKQVTYRNVAEMNAALDGLDREIAALEGAPKTRGVYLTSTKGW